MCRRGNQSQLALEEVQKIIAAGESGFLRNPLRDIIGGLESWANTVDRDFPIY